MQDAHDSLTQLPHFFSRGGPLEKNDPSNLMAIQNLKNSLPTQTPNRAAELDQKLRDAAQMYEEQFLQEMTKAMRSTISESGLIKTNQAEKIFKEQLDGQYTKEWAKQGGIGLADMVYKQMMEQHGVRMGLKAPESKPQGPISIEPTEKQPIGIQEKAREAYKIEPQSGS